MNFYSFTPAADNRNSKTGHVHKASAPALNCPDTCSLKGNGCYAENWPLRLQWAKQQQGLSSRSVTFKELLAQLRRIPAGEKVRMWEAGDFATTPTGGMDPLKLLQIIEALRGKRAWAYTHHIPGLRSVTNQFLLTAKDDGFTVNLSFDNNETLMDLFMDQGHACVIAVPSTEARKQWRTAGGHRVRVCPAHHHKGTVTCANCMLCHQRPADMAIAFPAHGTKFKTADAALHDPQIEARIWPATPSRPFARSSWRCITPTPN